MPPRVEASARRVQIFLGGVVIADSQRTLRVLERGHPPVYYVPVEDTRREVFVRNHRASTCEYKGEAHYYDLRVNGRTVVDAAWSYPSPPPPYQRLRDHVAVYPGRVDRATLDGEPVKPEPGDYFGGWITRDIVGWEPSPR